MRGKVFSQHRKYNSNRITPAYAGKSAVVELLLITRQDHPRLCGEKPFSQDIFPPVPGSPPPMRGKVTVNPDGSVTHGITPAYAGKSVYTYLILESCTGSPPPMRGKAFFRKTFFTGRRITPAYAGKRGGRLRRHCESEDHPRLCGEK